jgi:uridine phosphorylase
MSVPSVENKHTAESVFGAKDALEFRRRIGKGPRFKPPKGVILCYQKDLLNFIEQNYNLVIPRSTVGNLRLIKETDETIGVAADFGFGAPVAVVIMETLIAFGVKEFVSIGYAGTIQKGIKIGDTVVCERAIRDEGTSHHYIESAKYAHATDVMTARIKEALVHQKRAFTIGTSWTTDAPYRETRLEVERYQDEGVATVDMEASALFALAQYRNVSIGAAFTVSDSLAELKWKPHFHFLRVKRGLQKLFPVAVEALLKG